MRLIDADALLNILKREEKENDEYGLSQRADGITDAIMDLIDAPTIEPQRWVPVSERLPDELGDIVVISTKGGKVREATYVLCNDEQAFVTKDCWYCHGEVVAWMPLPKPWEGQNETRGVSETP